MLILVYLNLWAMYIYKKKVELAINILCNTTSDNVLPTQRKCIVPHDAKAATARALRGVGASLCTPC